MRIISSSRPASRATLGRLVEQPQATVDAGPASRCRRRACTWRGRTRQLPPARRLGRSARLLGDVRALVELAVAASAAGPAASARARGRPARRARPASACSSARARRPRVAARSPIAPELFASAPPPAGGRRRPRAASEPFDAAAGTSSRSPARTTRPRGGTSLQRQLPRRPRPARRCRPVVVASLDSSMRASSGQAPSAPGSSRSARSAAARYDARASAGSTGADQCQAARAGHCSNSAASAACSAWCARQAAMWPRSPRSTARGPCRCHRRSPAVGRVLGRRNRPCAAMWPPGSGSRAGHRLVGGRRASANTRSTRIALRSQLVEARVNDFDRADRTAGAPASFCWAATSCLGDQRIAARALVDRGEQEPAWVARRGAASHERTISSRVSGASATRSMAGRSRSHSRRARRVAAPDLVGVVAHDQRHRQAPAGADQCRMNSRVPGSVCSRSSRTSTTPPFPSHHRPVRGQPPQHAEEASRTRAPPGGCRPAQVVRLDQHSRVGGQSGRRSAMSYVPAPRTWPQSIVGQRGSRRPTRRPTRSRQSRSAGRTRARGRSRPRAFRSTRVNSSSRGESCPCPAAPSTTAGPSAPRRPAEALHRAPPVRVPAR